MYSQNLEEKFILEFFKHRIKGLVLDIGANDGKTFSNSLALIEKGWDAVLVEPSIPAFVKIMELHKERKNSVIAVNCAISEVRGTVILNESGPHLNDNSDFALLSSLLPEEVKKWQARGVYFSEKTVESIRYEDLVKKVGKENFDFITIDCEGLDLRVLKQINLSNTELLCIEHNSNEETKDGILRHCAEFGMTEIIYENAENILLCKKEQ